jgi:hypothetical protein
MKRRPIQAYLTDEQHKFLDEQKELLSVSKSDILSMLVTKHMESIKRRAKK